MPNVLFISTSFNSYYLEIIKEFEKRDFAVDWFSDRPSNSVFTKALIRLGSKLICGKTKRYERIILEKSSKKKYDLVFVILGQSFSTSFWERLRKTQPYARFLYYTWDSSENFPCVAHNIPFFDKAFCFDKRDSIKFQAEFLPLFYINQFTEVNETIKYDYSYIGTVKPFRYSRIENLISQMNMAGLRGYEFLYLHSPFVLAFYKMKYKSEFSKVKRSDLAYHYLSKEDCSKIESQSKYILDIPQKNQQGLTIRTFEAIALKRKLITTNADIKNYDFYNPNNIYIIENDVIDFENVFFKTDYEPIEMKIIGKYSISSWLDKIMEV